MKLTKSYNHKIETAQLVLSYLEVNLDYDVIREILNLKEKTLHDFVGSLFPSKNNYFQQIQALFSYQQILSFEIESYQFNKTIKDLLLKQFSYPFLLYLLMFLLLGFFSQFLIPTLIAMIQMFDLMSPFIFIGQLIIQFLFITLLVVNGCILILFLLLKRKQNLKLFYIKNHHKKYCLLYKKIISHHFVFHYQLLQNYGLSTKQSLEIIRFTSPSYITSWLSTLIMYQLEEGHSFEHCFKESYFDSSFIQLISLAVRNNQQASLIQTFLLTNQQRIQQLIILYAKILKTFVYIVLALVIIFLYQILLSPMNLIHNL